MTSFSCLISISILSITLEASSCAKIFFQEENGGERPASKRLSSPARKGSGGTSKVTKFKIFKKLKIFDNFF